MASLSLSLPGGLLIDGAITHLRRERARVEPARPRSPRVPDPRPIRVPGISREVVVKIASEPQEWEQAFELVGANYQKRGYEAATTKLYRFTPYHALPDTTLFVAREGERVLATFSLVPDNTLLGLPMEALYAAEIADLRRQGRHLAEVTSLAVSDLGQREFLQVFVTMIRVMKQHHVSRGGDTWVITVNPRHRNFYCKILGYQPLGPCKPYAAVGNAPAEAYVLDRDQMRTNAPGAYERIFGEWLPAEVLTGVALPRPFVRYFGAQSTQADEARIGAILRSVAAAGSPRAW
ncbi:MAG TPA: hypothetical protein VKA46_05960 [Gemmataceae bacterium]|nr:hypothetical protein [Gemmataceae bacterium]